ncbi:22331_t:CDS:2, partial [Gigaspora rosea]
KTKRLEVEVEKLTSSRDYFEEREKYWLRRAQFEQKEAIVDKYQKIVQSQNELLQDLTQESPYTSGSSRKKSENFGHLGTSLSFDLNNKETLKKCLENAFGAVENIDMIPSKAFAFADFATQTAYHAAVSEVAV